MRTKYVLRDGKWVNAETGRRDRKKLSPLGAPAVVGIRGPGYPFWSSALGCNPAQAKEFESNYARHGIQTKIHPVTGFAKVVDRGTHNRMILARPGCVNLDGGFGDVTQRKTAWQ